MGLVEEMKKDCLEMDKNENLILTGWGYTEYVASAAAALKALGGRADVYGVSRRRLPELLSELASERGTSKWQRVYVLGVSLSGDPDTLANALAKLKAKKVSVIWISALDMPDEISGVLKGLLDVRVFDSSLLEAVGESFGVDIEPFVPFANPEGARLPRDRSSDIRDYFSLIATAQFSPFKTPLNSFFNPISHSSKHLSGDSAPTLTPSMSF